MGYAVFTARKIMLNTKINNLQFRLMALSQQKQNLSQYSSNMQQQFGMMSMMLGCNNGGMNMLSNMLAMGGNQQMMAAAMMMQQGYNQQNMFAQMQYSAMAQSMLKPVAMAETQIDNEMKSIETQVKAAQAELDKVEQAEDKAIEKSAPKFA